MWLFLTYSASRFSCCWDLNMSTLNIHNYIPLILVICFLLSIPFLNKSSYTSWFGFRPASINLSQTAEPIINREVSHSFAENQSIVFKNEFPSIRLYFNIVRDTVCDLIFRTREQVVFLATTADIMQIYIR
jgi:hypothetical protein